MPSPLHAASVLAATLLVCAGPLASAKGLKRPFSFRRTSTFFVFENLPNATEIDTATVAEIVAATDDGMMLVYTDSQLEAVGFVDISNPSKPRAAGLMEIGGEPTSVGIKGDYALVAHVNPDSTFVEPNGTLLVIQISTQEVVQSFDLGGQPDSVAVSPSGMYAAIAIENERDEDLGEGRPPQLPAGFLVIMDIEDASPDNWSMRTVNLTGIADLYPEDPEPEFVNFNTNDEVAVTLQENNHVVIVDAASGDIVSDFSMGSENLTEIDILENDLIELTGSQTNRKREADAIVYIDEDIVATADEGDLDGGSRGFTIFQEDGTVLFAPGSTLEHEVVSAGHYPEGRSENKGCEPEAIAYGKYRGKEMLFVGTERSSVVLVYELSRKRRGGANGNAITPVYKQLLPAGFGPEGLLTIPRRNLLVVASEEDSREDGFRAQITLYTYGLGRATYPGIMSVEGDMGTPIPWAALSALAADKVDRNVAYTVSDSFFKSSRILKIDLSSTPALITDEILLTLDGETVDLDPEGLATRADGGFWLASEGSETSTNLLFKVTENGTIEDIVELPESVNALQQRFGFEGVTSVGNGTDEVLLVCFQREWLNDTEGFVRIGRYVVADAEWTFFYYPLDEPTSPNGGWTGLSEIISLDDAGTMFAVVERDNQAGPDATIKKIYSFSIADLMPKTEEQGDFEVITKTEVRDLLPDLKSDNGAVLEKVEGMMMQKNGDVWICTDNDGVDDSNGETQFMNIGNIF